MIITLAIVRLCHRLAGQLECKGGLLAVQIAALQTVPGSDQAALDSLPSDSLLAAATGYPQGSVTKMEQNITAALSGDTKSISMLRALKLFLERMGTEQQVSMQSCPCPCCTGLAVRHHLLAAAWPCWLFH